MGIKKETSEEKHEEFLAMLKPIITYMDENEVNYFLVAGKDELCSRYVRGQKKDLQDMICGMIENNPQVGEFLSACLREKGTEV